MVIVDRVQPEIEQSVHLGAFSKTEQPRRRAHRQKEEAGILLARAAIIQHGVIARPVKDAVLHKLSAANQVIFDEVMPLERIKLPQKLPVRSRAEPRPQLPQRADPLAGMHDVTDAVVALVGCAEIRVAAEHRIMKKAGASEEDIDRLEQNIGKLSSVTQLLTGGASVEDICRMVLEGFSPQILETVQTEYRCSCSRQRVERALISIGKKDLQQMMAEEETVEVNCHFCGKKYHFDQEDLKALLKKAEKKDETPSFH